MTEKRSKWRPYAEARKFAHSLKLSSQKEWDQYCKGELKGYPSKPKDIPKAPKVVYKAKGWRYAGDWLGNGKTAYRRKGHCPFTEARKFARSLKLSSQKEWQQYCKGELKGYPPKPEDIPITSWQVYKDKGWQGVGDWLGYRPPESEWRPYAEARKFAHSLKLRSREEWRAYCKGELKGYPPKPEDIPVTSWEVYKDQGWQGFADWLGYRPPEWRPYAEARKFARSLKLSYRKEWDQYCKGELKGYPPKPEDIPVTSWEVYKDQGWQGFADWLGYRPPEWRPYAEARNFARSLKLRSREEWRAYCKGELKGYPPKPEDIPATSWLVYKDQGWQGFADWLGKTR